MRFVICDADEMLSSMVDATITAHGHQVVGIADTTVAAIGLVERGRPDVVIVDPSVGSNADFDVIDAALAAGAKVIVFSRSGERLASGRYEPEPTFIAKPGLAALENIIERLRLDDEQTVAEADRRRRAARASDGPAPTGPTDAGAFYAALNGAIAGDALVAIAPRPNGPPIDPAALADYLAETIRTTDRVLIGGTSLLVLLPGGGEWAIDSLHQRIHTDASMSARIEFRSVVVADGEAATDAFDRLKQASASVRT